MAGFTAKERINRPPEEVFAYITNLENVPGWMPGVSEVEVLSQGQVAPGSKYRETRAYKQGVGKVEMEVTELEAPRRFATMFDRGGYRTEYTYSFTPEDSGTRVDLTCRITARGMKNLKLPLVAWAIKLQDKYQLRSLKEAIENKRE